jgi:hypothetical protein
MGALDKYKPNLPSIFNQFEPNKELSESDYAFDLHHKLLLAKRSQEFLFLAIGKILKEIRDNKIYQKLDFDNFGDYLGSEEISYSRESAFMFIRVYTYYMEYLEMDEERVGNINISRLSLMMPILKKIEDKGQILEKIDELSSLRHKDFLIRVKQNKTNDKPSVYYSQELSKWIVEYFTDRTQLFDLGNHKEYQEK